MTEASPSPDVPQIDPSANFNRAQAFRSTAGSLAINGLCPFLLYWFLAPHYPPEDITPLLYVMIFPILGFLVGLVRKRTLDAIAAIALAGIVIHLTVTVLSKDMTTALVLRSLQGAVVGLCFLLSALIGRPLLYLIARQVVTANAPERRARFDAVTQIDRGRTFLVATLVWGVGLMLSSAIHVALALRLAHATYLLVSPATGLVVNGALLIWSIRFITARLASHVHLVDPSPAA
jgi:hypothetical protein